MSAVFRELLKPQSNQEPGWVATLLWKLQDWRLNQVQAKINRIEQQIRKHQETTIDPLLDELREMEAEETIRAALGMKQ